jgi:hypothetical protein
MEDKICYNVKGKERRDLAQAISEVLNTVPLYKGVPSFVYEIGGCNLDKDGTITFNESIDSKEIERLKEELAKKGFVPAEQKLEQEGGFEIDMPREQFTELALENLKKIIDAKGALMASAIGTGEVKVIVTEDRVRLPWFPEPKSKEELDIYLRFAEAICNMAKTQKRVIAIATATENEKYDFRCFLLRLGFIGKEYSELRKFLLRNLTGNGAFKKVQNAEN